MAKTFTLHDYFNDYLDQNDFCKAKDKYRDSIRQNCFSMAENRNLVELIKRIKRTPDEIGPYHNLTPFEALNRIGSDLVLLAGADQLFNNKIPSIKPEKILLKMGNKAGYDVEIKTETGTIYGEAFNAAESFCKVKMRQSIDKLLDGERSMDVKKEGQTVIFYNADIKETIENYHNQKDNNSPVTIHKLPCDYEKVVEKKD